MRNTFLPAALMAFALTLAAAPTASAYPTKGTCTGCHDLDSKVTVSATFLGCSGTNATYNVSVSDTYNSGEGWAVFSGTTNVVNGYASGTSAVSQFTVAAGTTYTVRGVSDDTTLGGGKGGSAAVTVNPVCSACTPTTENCTDGLDNDCDGAVDCRDSNCSANPACVTCRPLAEVCDDGIDNDCDQAIDCADSDCELTCNPPGGGCEPTARSERKRCGDLVDNDCDGVMDCDDKDCARNLLCR